MKKWLYFSIVAVVLSVLLVGCDSGPDLPITTPEPDSPTIDPPVNELYRKEFKDKFIYDGKYIRKTPTQGTIDTIISDSI